MKIGMLPLIVGNWKMNPQTQTLSTSLSVQLKKIFNKKLEADVVIAPPHIFLESVVRGLNHTGKIALGAQNVHYQKIGSFTGEISMGMLQSYGVSYVILGHSERRRDGESNEAVNLKLITTIKAGATAILCVGETERDQNAHYLSLIEKQIRSGLATVPKARLSQVVVAYEPVWAIGTGDTATPADVHEMKLFIEKILSDLYGRNMAQKVRIIYGGSVNPKNARELFIEGNVDGFLVGGASLHADDFLQIVKATIA